MNREITLVKNSAFIFIGKMATVLANLLLLPLYTSILSTEEYGTVELITTIIGLALPMITLYIEQGMFRYMIENIEVEKRDSYSASSFKLMFCMTTGYIFVFLVVMRLISFKYTYYIAAIVFTQALFNWMLQYMRGIRKLGQFSLMSFLSSFITICLNILFLVKLKIGVQGVLISNSIAPFVVFLLFFLKHKVYKLVLFNKYDGSKIREMLKYSVALIPNSLSIWVLNSSDRLIVRQYMGIGNTGILSASHKFVSYYGYVNSTFLTSWQESGTIHYRDEDRDDFFNKTLEKTFDLFAAFSVLIIAVVPIVFSILIPNKSYSQAYFAIPIYIIAELFNTIIGFLGVIYIANKKTIIISISTMIIAALNIIVHVSTIKAIGLYAAAVSTAFSYFCILIFRIIDTKKYINLKYNWMHYALYFVLYGIVTYVYYKKSLILSLLVFTIVFLFLMFINRNLLKGVIAYVKKKISKN